MHILQDFTKHLARILQEMDFFSARADTIRITSLGLMLVLETIDVLFGVAFGFRFLNVFFKKIKVKVLFEIYTLWNNMQHDFGKMYFKNLETFGEIGKRITIKC